MAYSPELGGPDKNEKRCRFCKYIKPKSEFRTNRYGYPVAECRVCESSVRQQRKQETMDSRAIDRVLSLLDAQDDPTAAKVARVLRKQVGWPSLEGKVEA